MPHSSSEPLKFFADGFSLDILLTEQSNMIFCPVVFFLALAFADDVFATVSSPTQLFEKYSNVSCFERIKIPFKPNKLEQPLFQNHSPQKRGNLYHYCLYHTVLRDLSLRARYPVHIRPYTIRRGVATKIDGLLAPIVPDFYP